MQAAAADDAAADAIFDQHNETVFRPRPPCALRGTSRPPPSRWRRSQARPAGRWRARLGAKRRDCRHASRGSRRGKWSRRRQESPARRHSSPSTRAPRGSSATISPTNAEIVCAAAIGSLPAPTKPVEALARTAPLRSTRQDDNPVHANIGTEEEGAVAVDLDQDPRSTDAHLIAALRARTVRALARQAGIEQRLDECSRRRPREAKRARKVSPTEPASMKKRF